MSEVEIVHQQFFEKLKSGKSIICPCCERSARIWKRKINTSMARAIIALSIHGDDPVHLFRFLVARKIQHSDAPLLRHWELISELQGEREDGNPRNGHYFITQKGHDFARSRISVPRYIFLYNDSVRGFSDEKIEIQGALGSKFNYEELLAGLG